MPPLPGEESLITLFADVHYYLNAPGSRPQHERFARGSYVYLLNDPAKQSSRIEIANHAGTPEQDAFAGNLSSVRLEHKQKQPNLVAITVDDPRSRTAMAGERDQSNWVLPAYDLRHEQKHGYRIHTLEIYFWTARDAVRFVELCRRILPEQQLRVDQVAQRQSSAGSVSHSEHRDATHPVVQQLEQAAISDPYRETASATTTSQSSGANGASRSAAHTPSTSGTPPSLSVPAPYNPAAPAAPEPIAHREKTPPPPEAAAGTGLAAATVMDSQGAYQSQSQHYHQQPTSFFPGPPQNATASSFPPPPPGSPPAKASTPMTPSFPGPPSAAPQPYRQHSITSPLQSPGFPSHSQYNTPLTSPAYPSYQIGLPPPPSQPPLHSPGLPSPGFSNYTYAAVPPSTHLSSNENAVHTQFYRPTEAEMAHGHAGGHTSLSAAMGVGPSAIGSNSTGTAAVAQQPANATGVLKNGKLSQRVGKAEKGINGLLRRLDRI